MDGDESFTNVLLLVDTPEEMIFLRDRLVQETVHFVIHWEKLAELDTAKFCSGYYAIVIAAHNKATVHTLNDLRKRMGIQCRVAVIWIGEGNPSVNQNGSAIWSQDVFFSKTGMTQEALISSINAILSSRSRS